MKKEAIKFNFENYKKAYEDAPKQLSYKTAYIGTFSNKIEFDGKTFDNRNDFAEYIEKNNYFLEEHSKKLTGKEIFPGKYWSKDFASKKIIENNNIYNEIINCRRQLHKDYREYLRNNCKHIYIRFGLIPENGKSWNFRDCFYEKGVSCFDAYIIDDKIIVDIAGGMFTFYGYMDSKICYQIEGKKINEGSDGEPLLRNCKTVKKLNKENIYGFSVALGNKISL